MEQQQYEKKVTKSFLSFMESIHELVDKYGIDSPLVYKPPIGIGTGWIKFSNI